VRTLARAAGGDLALFSVVDDHVHLVLLADPPRLGRLTRTLVLGLRAVAVAPVESARVRPVESRAHLESLVPYVLGQLAHHGLPGHPALWTGSCFTDLVGARRLPGLTLRLAEALPRLARARVLDAAGLPGRLPDPASDQALRAGGPARLAAALTAAHAVPADLAGNTSAVVTARRAFAQLGRACGMAPADVAWTLGVTPRAARRLLAPPAPEPLLHAARLRHALAEQLADAPAPRPTRTGA
jgi:hypothetical protein